MRNASQMSSMMKTAAAAAILPLAAAFWLAKVNTVVPDPYLDEEFHVRQAQVYCKGDYQTWDPKITTPPGLYFVSWLIFKITGRCSILDLRALNVVAIILGFGATYDILKIRERVPSQTWLRTLTAANIWLFPPLFFFCGLYYTDPMSCLMVILSYQSYLWYEDSNFTSWKQVLLQVFMGVVALLFRQTNIFWTAVFPAGLALISSAKSLANRTPGAFGGIDKRDALTILADSWNKSRFYDLPVYDAGIEDYLLTAISLVLVTLANLRRSIAIILPCVTLIGLFAAFVAWNGGVVLGDKSNHVATLHLPQMLYLWPYVLFFSWTVVLCALVSSDIPISLSVSSITRKIFILGSLTNLAMVVVHFNTIVHPFTLADNRHYVFYVFRILMQKPELRYVAAPVYIFAGYLVIAALGAKPSSPATAKKGKSAKPPPSNGATTGFVLVWLITTALSLVTAPLVEPRYCIIPWMMWRLRVPTTSSEDERVNICRKAGAYATLLETLWFLAIAAGTGYMFLYRGFSWPQEPGKTQRFMW